MYRITPLLMQPTPTSIPNETFTPRATPSPVGIQSTYIYAITARIVVVFVIVGIMLYGRSGN